MSRINSHFNELQRQSEKNELERRKKERQKENQKLLQWRQELIEERRRLIAERDENTHASGSNVFSRQSNDDSLGQKVERARLQMPHLAERFQALEHEKERKNKLAQIPYKGELGVGSYEPWQVEDFYFVRGFIESWIDEVLLLIIYDPSGTVERIKSIAEHFHRQIDAVERNELLNEAVSSECLSILNEVNENLCFNVAQHCFTLHTQAWMVTNQLIVAAVTSQDGFHDIEQTKREEKQNYIFSAYDELQKERDKRLDIWAHSQKFSVHDGKDFVEEIEKTEDIFDGTVLYFHNLVPFDDVPDIELPLEFVKFRKEESKSWMGKEPIETSLPLSKRYRGVSCVSLSSSHNFVALGTVQGDIMVWDLKLYPPRILRSLKGNVSISDICWSIDSCKLLTLTEHGTVQLWSLMDTHTITFNVKSFEPSEPNVMFKPSTLQNLLTLELPQLFFTKGPFKESRYLINRPVRAVFYPALTFLASQNSIILGLENGNILKLNLNSKFDIATTLESVQPKNEIGCGIEAELFRAHEQSIIHISFVGNVSSMITVDTKGFINMWECSEEYLTGFNWFSPKKKFRLEMTEVTFIPVPGSQEKTEFSDKVKGKGKRFELNREDMIKKRKTAQTRINTLYLGVPWLTEEKGNLVSYVYATKNVPESGAIFHQISYYKNTGLLAQHTTRLFKPFKVPCSQLISSSANPSGTKLVFMLLFPKYPPKDPHVKFVILHLPKMTVSKNLIEALMTTDGFKKAEKPGACSFSITKPLISTGTEYIITNIAGVLCGFSIETGNTVLAETEKGWIGCHLSSKQSCILPTADIMVASGSPYLQFLVFAKNQNFVSLFHLNDKNSGKQHQTTWEMFKKWQCVQDKALCNRQQMWSNNFQWTFEGRNDIHIECSIETFVLDLVDQAIQIVDGPFTEEIANAYASENRQRSFVVRAEKYSKSQSLTARPGNSWQSTPVSFHSGHSA